MRDCLVRLIQLFVALRHAEICHRIFFFPDQRILITRQRSFVVFEFEVIVTDLIVLHGAVGIPRMHLLHIASRLVFWVGVSHAAVGMILGVVFRRAYVIASIAAGTLPSTSWCWGTWRSLILPRLLLILIRLRLGNGPPSQTKGDYGNKNKPTHT